MKIDKILKPTPIVVVLILAHVFQAQASMASLSSDTLMLHHGWVLTRAGDAEAFTAKVPGYTHETLLNAGVISDLHDERINVYGLYDYTYTLSDFGLPAGWESYPVIELVFEGIDTFARVYLNDSLIITADNYFKSHRLDVKPYLRTRNNALRVEIDSPIQRGEALVSELDHALPGEAIRAVARKPQYQYGWDWAPNITPSGIHRPVYLHAHHGVRLDYGEVRTLQLEGGSAILEYNATVYHYEGGVHELEITLSDGVGHYRYGMPVTLPAPQGGRERLTELNHRFELPNPKLWWTHELGTPFLYDVQVKLKRRSDGVAAYEDFKTGVRTIELLTSPDQAGARFAFVINGIVAFMRGANYVPPSVFEASVSDHEVLNLLAQTKNVHMNMLRIWGGGVYERDALYEWCSANGVLVWQDFMYACTMYPGSDAFIANAVEEAAQQVLRLRRHAALGLWCGNNEVSEGWWRWGWQDGLSEDEQSAIWQSYTELFKKKLPEVVSQHSNLPYWETSPMLGRGDDAHTTMGDAHYWGVWHDAEPFHVFEKRIPRFMSEFGMQSMPGEWLMQHHWEAAPDTAASEIRRYQKHPRGFSLLDQYLSAYYPAARDERDWAYLSQLLQRDGIVQGIQAHRSSRPYCMGSLYWQLNDCWPGISWSSIDYSGEWKALHYQLQQAFSPFYLWLTLRGGKISLFSANDTPLSVRSRYTVKVVGFDGTVYGDEVQAEWVTSQPSQGQNLWFNEHAGYPVFARGEAYIWLAYEYRGTVFTQALFAGPMRFIPLPKAEVSIVETRPTEKGYEYLVTCDSFARDIRLSTSVQGHFSANYFDLPARSQKWVEFYPAGEAADAIPQIHCLNCD